MILGGITLSDNMHLIGAESDPKVSYSVRDTLGGSSVTQIEQRDTGVTYELVCRYDESSRMGTLCQHQIESLQTIMMATNPVTMVHAKGTFTVYILKISVQQSDEREAPGPYKKFHGSILLQEV